MEAGFQVNPGKCYWFASKVQYLGFETAREGITPQNDKIQGKLCYNYKHLQSLMKAQDGPSL
jgi:hypothetical protein